MGNIYTVRKVQVVGEESRGYAQCFAKHTAGSSPTRLRMQGLPRDGEMAMGGVVGVIEELGWGWSG